MSSTITETCTVNYGGQLVQVTEGQEVTGGLARYLAVAGGPIDPDDDVAEWAEQRKADLAEAAEAAQSDEDDDSSDDTTLEKPPGNASRDDWAAYADQEGIAYSDDDGRNDIRDAVEAAQSDED